MLTFSIACVRIFFRGPIGFDIGQDLRRPVLQTGLRHQRVFMGGEHHDWGDHTLVHQLLFCKKFRCEQLGRC